MKIAFCWTNYSGYIASCWRAMQARIGSDNVLAACFLPAGNVNAAFDTSLVDGINVVWNKRDSYEAIAKPLKDFSPDAIVISGWGDPLYKQLYFDSSFQNATKIMAIDNQRKYTFRQFLGKCFKRPLLNRVDAVMVPGERSWQLAKYLGFKDRDIIRGTYGVNAKEFESSYHGRQSNPWPKQFVFVGRYVSAKAIDKLVAAYSDYRDQTESPWPLVTCGKGPLEHLVAECDGIINKGFVQPGDLPEIFKDSGVFVLPSRNEPWGQAIVEAAASGLPIICSEACGAGVEVVQNYYSGIKVPADDVQRLTLAMKWMHDNYRQLPEMGDRSKTLACSYDTSVWADRVLSTLNNLPNKESMLS